ncbi:MAG: hypothetical protein BGN91_00910 [Nitrobacter sp. 62-13]|nr:MAG: hypothetical protein BGN91_00910 [Nitrobacter sp. 62-13]
MSNQEAILRLAVLNSDDDRLLRTKPIDFEDCFAHDPDSRAIRSRALAFKLMDKFRGTFPSMFWRQKPVHAC